MNVSCDSRPPRRMTPAATANNENTPTTASAERSVRTYGCALLRPMNRNAITEPTSSSATPSTMPMLPARSPVRSITAGLRSPLTSCAAIVPISGFRASCESCLQCVCPRALRKGVKCFYRKDFSVSQGALQPHDVADDLGHRPVVLLGDFLVDLHGGVQCTGERHVLDDRDAVLLGDFANLERDIVHAFGDADRRAHALLVPQRDRIVGRVGDDYRGLRHVRHHALLDLALAQL